MSAKNPVKNLSRKEWLEKALSIVSREGAAKLRINNLVAEVGVTKGSFYWHFKDREDFVRSLDRPLARAIHLEGLRHSG